MNYRIMTLSELPELSFAHRYKTSPGSWFLSDDPHLLEITYCHEGSVRIERADGHLVAEAGEVICTTHSKTVRAVSDTPVHVHDTMAFRYRGNIRTVTQEELICDMDRLTECRDTMLILPEKTPAGTAAAAIGKRLEKIASLNAEGMIMSRLELQREILAVLTTLTQTTLDTLEQTAPSERFCNPHSRRAMQYLSTHLDRPLQVREMAGELGISYEHMSRLFRRDYGMTVVECLNRMRIDRVKELLLNKNITLDAAGQSVGINDEKYLSRLFRRCVGMTATEYRLRAHAGETAQDSFKAK